ncbi:cytochrome P450 [Streptomyces sp. BHT-5-2]|uniref:cytochrome P450 n=1 Tax=Streptomyces sp. BHT-5-2 TaxID=2866715 RepID=UPI001C8E27CE|nr:cytochrome P450 [Streptomyces sp. BHT-5-2]QZL04329.1 cytochrome P450 [Streptomyces sp. BHT-5-2]
MSGAISESKERGEDFFDPYGAQWDNPFPGLRQAQEFQPVFFSSQLDAWCVTRYDDIVAVLRDTESFSAREHNPRPVAELPPEVEAVLKSWRGQGVSMGSLDPPEHGRVRTAVNVGFTTRALVSYAPRIRAVAAGMLQRLTTAPDFDLVDEFARPYALTAVLSVLGIPEEYHERCRTWSEQRLDLLLRHDLDPGHAVQCARGLREYGEFATAITAERRARPQQDLISYLLHEAPSGHQLTAEEVAAQIPALITAGHETSAQALGSTVWQQLRSAGGWQEYVSGALTTDRLVEEGLRFDTALFGMYRTTLRQVTIADTVLAPGSRLLLLYGAGNHDASRYAEPDRFLPGRTSAAPHLAFGRGIHYCIGAPLARMALGIALEELALHIPGLALVPGTRPRYRRNFPLRAVGGLRVRP